MSIAQQALRLGFIIRGELVRHPELETSGRYRYYLDDSGNAYILRRGILTVISADGTVY